MPTEVKLWQIEDDKPKHIQQGRLDLESRLEDWLRDDIGFVNDDLLVIGQQVKVEHGGKIDLVAVDSDANLVILELKRDKTPRDIVAQVLDYASWVQKLDYEDVEKLASDFLPDGKPLEQAFKEKFRDDLPETVNESHRMYIVGSSLDPATERIVQYLAETHRVDINVANFAYFKTSDGAELIGRSMLLDEEAVDNPGIRITPKELRDIAKENGVLDLWDKAFDEFRSISYAGTPTRGRGRQGMLFFRVRHDGSLGWFLRMCPGESSSEKGLSIEIRRSYMSGYFNISEDQIQDVWESEEVTRSFDATRLDNLISLLKQNAP